MSPLEVNSEYLKLVKSGDLYKQIFNYSVLPIIVHDMYFNILKVNEKASEIFGYSKEELLKMEIFDLHVDAELEHSVEVLEKIKDIDGMTVKTFFKRKDGSVFSAEASPCKISYERFSIIHVHLQNVSFTGL